MESKARWGLVLLTVLTGALLLVGVVSGTLLRHVVQVVPPLVLIVAVVVWRPRGWPAAAMAIELFWLVIMFFIWLYLTGVARIVKGHFSPSEIALTMVIGAAAAGGIVIALKSQRVAWPVRVLAFLFAGLVQFGAMWLSVQPGIGTR
ncbi:MAG TPA: hypothetical protein VLC46_09335 [Thermoanaerobaculia bacterium]|jgi:hypothetical protein|nr:hypothetical protein [Thermoanaerobaculia bacterium]